jgi:hypothetical protein
MVFFKKTGSVAIPSSRSMAVRMGSSEAIGKINDIITKAVGASTSTVSYEDVAPFGSIYLQPERSLSGKVNVLRSFTHLLNFRAGGRTQVLPEVEETPQYKLFSNELSELRKIFKNKNLMNPEKAAVERTNLLERVVPRHEQFQQVGTQIQHFKTEILCQQIILQELEKSFEGSHHLILSQKQILNELNLELSKLEHLWQNLFAENFLALRSLMEVTQPTSPLVGSPFEPFHEFSFYDFGLEFLNHLSSFSPLICEVCFSFMFPFFSFFLIFYKLEKNLIQEMKTVPENLEKDDFHEYYK